MASIDGRRAAIIDTRGWDEFRAGHLAGSLSHPLGKSFPTDVGSMVRESEDIYLVIEPARLEEAIRDLIRVGLDLIVGWFDATKFGELSAAGARIEATREVSVAEGEAMIARGEVALLDVRRASEFAEGHIDGALNIAHTRLDGRLEEVPRGRPVLVNCRSGARSARACALLQKHGHEVANLAGGFLAWEKAHPAAGVR